MSLTGLLTSLFNKKVVDPAVGRLQIEDSFNLLIEHTAQELADAHPCCFAGNPAFLDDLFWGDPRVEKEFSSALSDRCLQREPDYEILWQAFQDPGRSFDHVDETTRLDLDQKEFILALQSLWARLMGRILSHHLLSRFYDQKVLAELGKKTVYDDDVRHYIKKYCRLRLPQRQQRLREKYSRGTGHLVGYLPEEIEKEFCTYLQTPMQWVPLEREGRVAGAEEQEVKGDYYLTEDFLLFVGRGGVGKTRFFEELEIKALRAMQDDPDPAYLPIYFEARHLTGIHDKKDLVNFLEAELLHVLEEGDDLSAGKAAGLAGSLVEKGKLFILIDAFDQAPNYQEHQIARLLASRGLLGNCRRFVSTRPYDQESLTRGLLELGALATVRLIRLLPFRDENQVRYYFGRFYPQVATIYKELSSRAARGEADINLLQIPELARLVKIMAMAGEVGAVANRAELMVRFVRHVAQLQGVKDTGQDTRAIREMRQRYKRMLLVLEDLALATLAAGEKKSKFVFSEDRIINLLGREAYDNLELMERSEFLSPFLDLESTPEYRFQHQLLQEFLAAMALWRLYRKNEPEARERLFQALIAIRFDPEEVGGFLAELIATHENQCPADDLRFWHGLLVNPAIDDWLRTYALQIRDNLAASTAAAEFLAMIVEEDAKLGRMTEKEDEFVTIPGGSFVYGSYEYGDGRPVRFLPCEAFEIGRFPVTNEQFCVFLQERFAGVEPRDEEDQLIYFDKSKIKQEAGKYGVSSGFARHPVTGVTWYGITAYCHWRSQRERRHYWLPSEQEWEKAARGCLGRRYPWGNKFIDKRCNTVEWGIANPIECGNYPEGRSPFGCHDMAGNVWEWTSSDNEDYKGEKTARGGSWGGDARCAVRDRFDPIDWAGLSGFRCARTLDR